MLEKTEISKIYKDAATGALINKDINRLRQYKQQKKFLSQTKKDSDEIGELKSGFSEIQSDLNELKGLVKHMLSRINERMED